MLLIGHEQGEQSKKKKKIASQASFISSSDYKYDLIKEIEWSAMHR